MYKQECIIQKKAQVVLMPTVVKFIMKGSRFLLISNVVMDYHLSSHSSYGIHCKHKEHILLFQKDSVGDVFIN